VVSNPVDSNPKRKNGDSPPCCYLGGQGGVQEDKTQGGICRAFLHEKRKKNCRRTSRVDIEIKAGFEQGKNGGGVGRRGTGVAVGWVAL